MINNADIASLVRPDQVHGRCYTDRELFDLERARLWEHAWIFAGHESQVKRPGDFYTFEAAGQPMMMVRGSDAVVRVLFDRCAHRGSKLCGRRYGNAGDAFRCSYHGWSFELDGTLQSIPHAQGYEGTTLRAGLPEFNLARAPRTDSYRGFVFMSLDPDIAPLAEWLGPARIGFDDMCDRSPVGEVEAVGDCNRIIQRSNWKFFMENQLDAVARHDHARVDRPRRARSGGRDRRAHRRARRCTITCCRRSRRRSTSGTRCC